MICVFDRIVRRRLTLDWLAQAKEVDPMPGPLSQIKHRLTVKNLQRQSCRATNSSDFVSPDLVMVLTWPPSETQSPSMLEKSPFRTASIHNQAFWLLMSILTLRTRSLKTAPKLWSSIAWTCLSQTLTCLTAWRRYRKGWRLLSLWWRECQAKMPSGSAQSSKLPLESLYGLHLKYELLKLFLDANNKLYFCSVWRLYFVSPRRPLSSLGDVHKSYKIG